MPDNFFNTQNSRQYQYLVQNSTKDIFEISNNKHKYKHLLIFAVLLNLKIHT